MRRWSSLRAEDLRVGTVKEASRIKGSDKLLKLAVDLGETTTRVIVAGIAESYTTEELCEKQVVVVANMKPTKLFGVESHGMLLATENGVLLEPDEPVENGCVVAFLRCFYISVKDRMMLC